MLSSFVFSFLCILQYYVFFFILLLVVGGNRNTEVEDGEESELRLQLEVQKQRLILNTFYPTYLLAF